MTAESPGKRIERAPTKESPLRFSPESKVAASRVAKDLAEGKKPAPGTIGDLVTSIGTDLKKEGIPVTKSDYKALMKQAEAAYSGSAVTVEPHVVPEATEPPAINLEEYRNVMGELFDTYKLGSGNWQTITGIYGASDLIGNVIAGYETRPWVNEEARHAFTEKIDKGLDLLNARKTPLNQIGREIGRLDPKKRKEALGLLLSATWPWLAGTAHWFLGRRAEKFAGSMFAKERSKLQRAVNTRISESLFMRNFEFLHDKPAGEIMEIINKGQFSTIDLISVTYTEFLPTLLSIVSQLPRQWVTGKLEFVSSLIKIPFLIQRSETNAKAMQSRRAEEMALADKVHSKLMTTISGLESARTSGSAPEGAKNLLDALTERDTLEAHGLGQRLARHRQMNLFFDVMDVGMPLVSELWQFSRKPRSGAVSGELAFNTTVDALSRIVNSKNQQMEMRSAFAALTRMYVDQIIPDIQDIQRMDAILGKYDELDRPNGPKERARLPVSKLPNTDIKITGISYKNILRNVSLDIPKGSFVTIKGESGTGKTTLIRNLVGLYTPDSGSITVGGVPIDQIKKYGPESVGSVMGYANQNPQILEGMTLKENLLLWSQQKVPDQAVTKVMRDLRLEHLMDRLDTVTKHFSGGELRRIGIARALLKNPKILVLDEPTANLDEASAQQVLSIIQNIRTTRPDMTVVAITHDPAFENIAEKIVDIRNLNKNGTTPEISEPTLNDHQVLEAIARPKRAPAALRK